MGQRPTPDRPTQLTPPARARVRKTLGHSKRPEKNALLDSTNSIHYQTLRINPEACENINGSSKRCRIALSLARFKHKVVPSRIAQSPSCPPNLGTGRSLNCANYTLSYFTPIIGSHYH